MRRYRRYGGHAGTGARFDDYGEIEARFDSLGTCGHEIKRGQRIGYARRTRETQCPDCWAKWCAENAEADAIESGYSPCPW